MTGDMGTGIAAGAKTGATVSVVVAGVAVRMQAPRDLTLAAGDLVVWQQVGSRAFVLNRYGTAGVADQPDNITVPPPKPASVVGSRTITPVTTGTWNSTSWRTDNDDLYQGETGGSGLLTGAAFYGPGPAALSGATVTAASVQVRRRASGGSNAAQTATLRLVTETTRPAGAPTLTSSTAGPTLAWGESVSFTVPTAWAQAMVDGTAGGLAVHDADGTPYMILEGRARYAPSFALTIRYSRTL